MCGRWPDNLIYKSFLYWRLPPDEIVHANRGYKNTLEEQFYVTPDSMAPLSLLRSNLQARSRHEIANGVYKKFKILKHEFRHRLDKHGKVFRAVTTFVFIIMNVDVIPYDVDYSE